MERDQILFRLYGRFCPEGTILYTEGSPGEELYFVQSGAVRLRRGRGTGSADDVRGPEEILGEETFFGRAPHGQRAEVLKDSRLLLVSDRTLDALVRHGPDVARLVTERVLGLASRAAAAVRGVALARAARRAAPHLRGPHLLSVESLGEAASLSTEESRAVLEAFTARGALVRETGGYRIAEASSLERVLEQLSGADG